MDRKSLTSKFKVPHVKGLKWALPVVIIGLVAGSAGWLIKSYGSHISLSPSGLMETYGQAWLRVQKRVEALKAADEQNERLKLENAHLRLLVESMQFDCHADAGTKLTHDNESRLMRETGSRLGRTLASINYKLPMHLLPSQLHTLGTSYFKGREDDKAAVIFTFLTNLEDDDTYKTPKDYLIAGVSWYRLDNLDLAESYFDRVLKTPETRENAVHLNQARIWRGLIAERQGKHIKSQDFLREVLDSSPKSREAAWINSGGTHRAPAHAK